MNENETPLTYKKIFKFWYPLSASWLMMAAEMPFLAAIIARLGEPKYNLAAFGVAYSIALVVEAPIIMLLSASTALSKNKNAYSKLYRFSYALNIGITVAMIVLLVPGVFDFFARDLMELPDKVARLTYNATFLLLPWPAAIGFRRFYQGIMIRYDLTRRVAYGTVVRLVSMAVTGIVLFFLGIPGAYVGAAALSMGVINEAIASRIMAHHCMKDLRKTEPTGDDLKNPLTYRGITKFYYPLAVMTSLSLGIQPMVTFFMSLSRFPIESLAVLPVVNSLVFVFRSFGLSYQEVVIALLGEKKQGYIHLRNFAVYLGVAVTAGLAAIAFTPAANIWFHHVSGLSVELSSFAYVPSQIMVILPALTVLISFQRSVLVSVKKTGPITLATIIEVGVIFLVLIITIRRFDFVGVVAAALSYIIGRLCANLFLSPFQMRAARN